MHPAHRLAAMASAISLLSAAYLVAKQPSYKSISMSLKVVVYQMRRQCFAVSSDFLPSLSSCAAATCLVSEELCGRRR